MTELHRVDMEAVASSLAGIEGVRAGLVVGRDGSPIAGISSAEDEVIFGALMGAIFGAINNATQRTGLGELDDVLISASYGSIQAMGAGNVILVVLTEQHTNVGYIRLEMRRAARALLE